MGRLFRATITLIILLMLIFPASCSGKETISNEKTSSLLLTQINLKKEQIDKPTAERLNIMREMGMMVDNLENQRIFIHLERELDDSQVKELQNMGLTLYLDSWIPPVGAHPTGFVLAEVPVDKLEALAEKDYIVKLDTAERVLKPQVGSGPQVE